MRPPPGSTPAQNSAMSCLHGETVFTPAAAAGVPGAAAFAAASGETEAGALASEGTATGAAGFAASGVAGGFAAGGVACARAEPARTPTPRSTKPWNLMSPPLGRTATPESSLAGLPANGKQISPTPDSTPPPLELLDARTPGPSSPGLALPQPLVAGVARGRPRDARYRSRSLLNASRNANLRTPSPVSSSSRLVDTGIQSERAFSSDPGRVPAPFAGTGRERPQAGRGVPARR